MISVVVVALRVVAVDGGVNNIPPKMSCPQDELEPYECAENTASDITSYAVMAVVVFALWGCYIVSVRLAWRSQMDLPNARFRISKLLLRIQMRYGRLLFFAILYTGVVVELATIGTCWGRINSLLGSPAAHLSLAVYSCTLFFLFAPGTERSESTSAFKSIAWREDDVGTLMAELKACQESRYVPARSTEMVEEGEDVLRQVIVGGDPNRALHPHRSSLVLHHHRSTLTAPPHCPCFTTAQ